MDDKKIARINELYHKSKAEGLLSLIHISLVTEQDI